MKIKNLETDRISLKKTNLINSLKETDKYAINLAWKPLTGAMPYR